VRDSVAGKSHVVLQEIAFKVLATHQFNSILAEEDEAAAVLPVVAFYELLVNQGQQLISGLRVVLVLEDLG